MDSGMNYYKWRLATAALLFLAVLLTFGIAVSEQTHEAKVIFYVA